MKKLKKFGESLRDLRIEKQLGLREVCKETGYDPSNWSKIERGIIAPPADDKILSRWLKILGVSSGSEKFQELFDEAKIAQGIIPQDILSQENAVGYLPAFFRTLRGKKPTKEEMDKLIELIRNA